MRNYVGSQSKLRSETYYFRWFRLIVRNLRHRNMLLKLDRLTSQQLKDIGLTHKDLRYLGCLPLSVDLDWEAERLRLIAARRDQFDRK
jgi:uncharacterized protein YjiS (DUF1127 family)